MASKIDAGDDVKRKDMFAINPVSITVDPELRGRSRPRSREEIKHMAENIAEVGQLQPCRVRRLQDKKVQLVAGYNRYQAVLFHNTEIDPGNPILLQCTVTTCNEKEAFLQNVTENAVRYPTTPIDDAQNQRKMREQYGMNNAAIAKFYNCSPNKPGQLEKLLLLDEKDQDKVHYGTLSVRAALDLLEIDPSDRAELEDEEGELDSEKVSEAKREKRAAQGKNTTKTIKAIRKFLTDNKELHLAPAIRRFCGETLDWLNGKKGDKAMENAIERLHEVKPKYDEDKEENLGEAA